MSTRFQKFYIASSYDAAHLMPWGSHPLLDPYYGSSYLEIEHHGIHMSRFEKTALVADWPVALENILVCEGKDSGETNCGICEKCIRTMTTLVALEKLKTCSSFPFKDVPVDLLATIQKYDMIRSEYQASWYGELISPLEKRGREELALKIREILEDYRNKYSKVGAGGR